LSDLRNSVRNSEVSDGTLTVRVARNGNAQVVALRGELDLANAGTAEGELETALADGSRVVVDMRALEFIDSTGIALLVASLNRAGADGKLTFVPSATPAVNRVLDLTGVAERLPVANGSAAGLLDAI
jgi:anti-anti-sigma factor